MKVLDPGHRYLLAHLDGDAEAPLVFVKRVGEKYPGNVGPHEGTTTQEVLRALIERAKFVEAQKPSRHNAAAIYHLREALFALELRAAVERDDQVEFSLATSRRRPDIEVVPTCGRCGHVACRAHR